MIRKTLIYLAAWMVYAGISFFLFPFFSITVMLASIPLAMLGGWLFRYSGAIATTLLTVPYHYLMLSYHSDSIAVIREAFNPFAFTSLLVFSGSTTLMKTSQERHQQLNKALQKLIDERTSELKQVTNRLLEIKQHEHSGILSTLLEKPLEQLHTMHRISLQIEEHQEKGSTKAAHARHITDIIDNCANNIQALKSFSTINDPGENLEQTIRQLADQLTQMSEVKMEIIANGAWPQIGTEKTHHLCHLIHEAVSNALRHAAPTHIKIILDKKDTEDCVYIENDGTPLPASPQEGMGIPLMNYRASKIGGHFKIGSMPNQNTRVECRIPAIDKNLSDTASDR
jgi:signal transduction histidine kinase